jgi:hypothetical protein
LRVLGRRGGQDHQGDRSAFPERAWAIPRFGERMLPTGGNW